MSKAKLSRRSEVNLRGVHPELVRVVRRALEITKTDFTVIEGYRSEERQRQLVRNGTSQTLNSRHLTGHAVDCVPLVHGSIPWNDPRQFKRVADAMFQAAREQGVRIRWGSGSYGSMRNQEQSSYGGPHFELCHQECST